MDPAALDRADPDAQLVAVGRAIGDPLRLRLARALAEADRPASSSQLAERVGGDVGSVTRHLHTLERLGVADQTGVWRHQRVPVRRYTLTDVGRYLLEHAGAL